MYPLRGTNYVVSYQYFIVEQEQKLQNTKYDETLWLLTVWSMSILQCVQHIQFSYAHSANSQVTWYIFTIYYILHMKPMVYCCFFSVFARHTHRVRSNDNAPLFPSTCSHSSHPRIALCSAFSPQICTFADTVNILSRIDILLLEYRSAFCPSRLSFELLFHVYLFGVSCV